MKSRSVLFAGIVSVVSLAGCATYDDDDHYRVRAPDDVQRGPYSALEVYSLPDFRGETMKFDRDGHTLDRMISDNGVGSLVIEKPTPPITPCSAARIRLVVTLAEMRSRVWVISLSRCSASNGRMLRTPRIIWSASRKK